jgi:hypothetical protein
MDRETISKKPVSLPPPVQISYSCLLLAQRAAPQYRRPDGLALLNFEWVNFAGRGG